MTLTLDTSLGKELLLCRWILATSTCSRKFRGKSLGPLSPAWLVEASILRWDQRDAHPNPQEAWWQNLAHLSVCAHTLVCFSRILPGRRWGPQ